MNHPDWPAFLAAIVASPDDDTLRLVAADFLEENGDLSRAAFIRTQIALARLEASGLGHTSEAGALRKQELTFFAPRSSSPRLWAVEDCPELVHDNRTRTQSGFLALRAEGVERLKWRRGFVEWVTCQTVEWLRHGVASRKRNPVRRVILSDRADLAGDTWTAGLDALRGLSQVDLKYYVAVSPQPGLDLCEWLRERLPGTLVNAGIRGF